MGDPRKIRRKYAGPAHPWQKDRIEAEKVIVMDYGIRRKNELWKMSSLLSSFLNRAKNIIARRDAQSEVEKRQLLDRLIKLGLLSKESRVEDVLGIKLKDIMERRLQTILVRKNVARSMLQSRQFITHQYVAVGANKITSPSYLVATSDEPLIRLVREIKLTLPPTKEQKQEAKAEAKQ